ncbi:DEAD/DEAH box helicase [Clostridium sp. 'deep sea']|uniref:ATP-dependent DNA helicase n=1 Tax=Clostridium sp. 'deep sea' TaxID=2779445 RepID=UPI001896A493|nr:helicase C-terminal domain-containing protein [Clostridium sp. 'deep sea']QOR34723.1 DEAD/DEAH box helicase [Clostridium sp. 'deep sea']
MHVKAVKQKLESYLNQIKSFFPNYEDRPQQYEMIRAILNGIYKKKHILIEAGTGTGKSLAYILALLSIIKANELKEKAIISTYTINLQQQLIEKDIPLLQKILDEDFKVAIAKGRSNYLCQNRVMNVLNSIAGLFSTAEEALNYRELLDEVYDGSGLRVGDRADLTTSVMPSVWNEVCSSRETCLEDSCPYEFKCQFKKARKELHKADIVIANHALFFVDLMLRGDTTQEEGGILPTYDYVVFDEAHHVEDAATSAFSITVDSKSVNQPAAWLQNMLKREVVRTALTECGYTLNHAAQLNQQYFAKSNELMQNIEKLNGSSMSKRVSPLQIKEVENSLNDTLTELIEITDKMSNNMAIDETTAAEIERLRLNFQGIADNIDFVLNAKGSDYVYWVESRNYPAAFAAPLNIAEMMNERIFTHETPIVCTSATLAVPDMNYFAYRMGVENYNSNIIYSPFNYEKQAKLIVPNDALEPDFNNINKYENYIANTVLEARNKIKGGIFVLFTSYKMLDSVHNLVASKLLVDNKTILKQGETSRSELIRKFKSDGDAILFGTSSFWEGVDVAGDSLRCVIITKLPFPVPDDPLAEARMDKIKATGGNPFGKYMLPQAVLHFKQGFGRLIRSKSDSGLVIVTDKRLVSKRYGSNFIKALPQISLDNEIKDIKPL